MRSVLELIKLLHVNEAVYIPSEEYKSSSESSEIGNFKLIEGSKSGSFKKLSFNKTKLNVSVEYTYKGAVRLDIKDKLGSEIVALGAKKHLIIKNGKLNMDKLSCKLDVELLKDTDSSLYEIDGDLITFDLTKLPVVDIDTLQIEDVYTKYRQMEYLKAKVKELPKADDFYEPFDKLDQFDVDLLKTKYSINNKGYYYPPRATSTGAKKPKPVEKELFFKCKTTQPVEYVNIFDKIVELELELMNSKIFRKDSLWFGMESINNKDKFGYKDLVVRTKN